MSDDTDFVALYNELGLDAECSMLHFKHAYRRRVMQLHPDHQRHPADVARLQRLNRMYAAALEFHRAHGRLPGASRPTPVSAEDGGGTPVLVDDFPPAPAPGPALAFAAEQARWTRESEPANDADEEPVPEPVTGFPRRRRYLLILALLALVLYWWGAQKNATPSLDPAGPGDAVSPGLGTPEITSRLAVGMDARQARRILGEPDGEHAARWDYGPSWVEFRCGRVAGWYSSPLRPLRVDEASAHAATEEVPHC
ncbi:hypothetical protein M8R20_45475 [Pseudomonas sp. R2.Fl]|nr:hypothetical protein [Pseudomonas sp. R2.Fl]